MSRLLATTLFIGAAAAVAAQAPLRTGTLRISEPTDVATIDFESAERRQPSRLAWSPDGSQLYVQAIDGEFGAIGVKQHHYLFAVAGGARRELQQEPEWASEYWVSKSGQVSPDGPPLKIELKSGTRAEKTVSTPMGGDLARGGSSSGAGAGNAGELHAAFNTSNNVVHSMHLHGETIGEYVNSVIVPGQTFGWGPKGSRAIAFATLKGGRVAVMDDKGEKREVPGTKDAIFPAWSQDGQSLAWLQRDGKKKYVLRVARVSGT